MNLEERTVALVNAYVNMRDDVKQVDLVVSNDPEVPVGISDYLGTAEPRGEDPAIQFDERIGRCYELCNYALLFGDAPAGTLLVHGTMHGPEAKQRIRHSWLLIRTGHGDLIWEPAQHLWRFKEDWYRYARVWEEREYTKAIVQRLTLESGHYGPWHTSRYR